MRATRLVTLIFPRRALFAKGRVSPYPALRSLAAAMICLGCALGPALAQEPAPDGSVTQQPGAVRQRKDIQQPGPVQEIEPQRPGATAVQPPPQCAPQPQCAEGSVAVCTQSGACQSGSNRPEQACLNYACVAKLLPMSPALVPKQPLAVTPKPQPGIVGAP
jgi:hypothetical protein